MIEKLKLWNQKYNNCDQLYLLSLIIDFRLFLIFIIFYFLLALKDSTIRWSKYYLILIIALFISIYYRNYLGVYSAIMTFVGIESWLYIYRRNTKETLENNLNLVLKYSFLPLVVALAQLLMGKIRIDSVFFNANYFAAVALSLSLLACYLYLKERKWSYIIYFLINLASLLISQSRTGLIALIFSVLFLVYSYLLDRKYLFLLFSIILIYLFGIFFLNFPFPRSIDIMHDFITRQDIWHCAIMAIKKSIFFGYGNQYYLTAAYTFHHYLTYHSHNIFLESLLSYGIFGTTILLFTAIRYFFSGSKFLKALIISIFLFGIFDVTLFWHQSGILILAIILTDFKK